MVFNHYFGPQGLCEDIFGYYNWGRCGKYYWWGDTKDAAKFPKRHGTAPYNTELSGPKCQQHRSWWILLRELQHEFLEFHSHPIVSIAQFHKVDILQPYRSYHHPSFHLFYCYDIYHSYIGYEYHKYSVIIYPLNNHTYYKEIKRKKGLFPHILPISDSLHSFMRIKISIWYHSPSLKNFF